MSMTYSGLASRSFIIGSRLSARDQPGLVTQPLQESDGLVDARGPCTRRAQELHG